MATEFSHTKRMTGFDSYLEALKIERKGFLVSPRRSETLSPHPSYWTVKLSCSTSKVFPVSNFFNRGKVSHHTRFSTVSFVKARFASHYVEGRSSKWLKVKVHQEDEFVIGSFTKPAGSRKYLGALLLGAYEKGLLRYVGKVGTGLSHQTLADLYQQFKPLVRGHTAFVDAPCERGVSHLAPHLIAQVSFPVFQTGWFVESLMTRSSSMSFASTKSLLARARQAAHSRSQLHPSWRSGSGCHILIRLVTRLQASPNPVPADPGGDDA